MYESQPLNAANTDSDQRENRHPAVRSETLLQRHPIGWAPNGPSFRTLEIESRSHQPLNLKLDELTHSIDAAGNHMLVIEKLSHEELNVLQAKYQQLRADCVENESADIKK